MYESKAYVLKLWFHLDQQPSSSTMEQHAVVLVQWPVVHCQFSRVSYAAHPKILNYIHNAVLWKLFCHHCFFRFKWIVVLFVSHCKIKTNIIGLQQFSCFSPSVVATVTPICDKTATTPFFLSQTASFRSSELHKTAMQIKAASYRERFRVQSSRFCPQIDTDYHRFYYFPPAALNPPSS